ncbi:MAG: Single-strand binding protein family [Thermoleophilaceae bacterium]|nr:Single-strand binding protein family [Thermoleophilaceae bacterium]
MNSVSLVGWLTAEPALATDRAGLDECRMRIAVERRRRGGAREPGVVYVEVAMCGRDARECAARLKTGDRIGLSGRLEPEDGRHVVVEQLDFL